MSKIHWKHKGFTLIESMVVLSVMGVLALLIFTNYHNYTQRNQLREAAQQVRSALVEAQNMALAPKDAGAGTDWYYGLTFDATSTTNPYKLYKYRVGGSDPGTPIRTYTLPNSVRWASTQSSWGATPKLNLFFKPPKADAYKLTTNPSPPPSYNIPAQPDTGTYTFTLQLSDGSYSTNVIIKCITGQTNVNP